MTQIIVDASLSDQLHRLTQVVELCDPDGRVLGRFIPTLDRDELEIVGPELSEEELQERERSTEWYTTEEVLAFLQNLEKQ